MFSITDKKLLIATYNNHKVIEMCEIISQIIGKDISKLVTSAKVEGLEDVIENGISLKENSLLKAKSAFDQTQIPVMSDDSGIFVDVLGQAPGIFSARWAGKHGDDNANLDLLLNQLQDIPKGKRQAHFSTVITLIDNGNIYQEEGIVEGFLRFEKEGEQGFGYDPIFEADEIPGKTLAQISLDEKNIVSHRARAINKLSKQLIDIFK